MLVWILKLLLCVWNINVEIIIEFHIIILLLCINYFLLIFTVIWENWYNDIFLFGLMYDDFFPYLKNIEIINILWCEFRWHISNIFNIRTLFLSKHNIIYIYIFTDPFYTWEYITVASINIQQYYSWTNYIRLWARLCSFNFCRNSCWFLLYC